MVCKIIQESMNKVLTAQNRICAGNRPAIGAFLPVRKGVGVGMPAGMDEVDFLPFTGAVRQQNEV
jgi:hypothetical protein